MGRNPALGPIGSCAAQCTSGARETTDTQLALEGDDGRDAAQRLAALHAAYRMSMVG